MTTEHKQTLEREAEDVDVTVTCRWHYERGEFIEPGHRCNGYGKGWVCDEITATDARLNSVELTEAEKEEAQEKSYDRNFR